MTEPISREAYEQASAQGQLRLAATHAVSASYDKDRHELSLNFSTGQTIRIDTRESPFFKEHPDADLSDPQVSPGGDGLHFGGTDIDVHIPGLLGIPETASDFPPFSKELIDSFVESGMTFPRLRKSDL